MYTRSDIRSIGKLCNAARKNGQFSAEKIHWRAVITKKWIQPC